MGVDNVRNLLGQNVGDLQKARNHPNVILWMHSHNMSDLSEMGLKPSPTMADVNNRPPNTADPLSNVDHTLDLPGSAGVSPASGMVRTPVPILCKPLAVPVFHLPPVSQVTEIIA